mgnify:CR=1 FL=1
MIEIFLEMPMEYKVMILSCITIIVYEFIKDEKSKNTNKKYEN